MTSVMKCNVCKLKVRTEDVLCVTIYTGFTVCPTEGCKGSFELPTKYMMCFTETITKPLEALSLKETDEGNETAILTMDLLSRIRKDISEWDPVNMTGVYPAILPSGDGLYWKVPEEPQHVRS